MTTLYREIDALGGYVDITDKRAVARAEQLDVVLAILAKRGFTEQADAAPPLYDRLVKLAESVAAGARTDDVAEARAIITELHPVDPDIQAARDIVADEYLRLNPDDTVGQGHPESYAGYIREGAYDTTELAIVAAIIALKRGRELAVQS